MNIGDVVKILEVQAEPQLPAPTPQKVAEPEAVPA